MGGSPKYPKATDEELALYRQQTEYLSNLTNYLEGYYQQLTKQAERRDKLEGMLLQLSGIETVYNEDGSVSGYKWSEQATDEQERNRKYMEAQYDYSMKQLEYQSWLQDYNQKQLEEQAKYNEWQMSFTMDQAEQQKKYQEWQMAYTEKTAAEQSEYNAWQRQFTQEQAAKQDAYNTWYQGFTQDQAEKQAEYNDWQRSMTQRQVKMDDLLRGVQLEEAGYQWVYDENGEISGVEKRALTEEEQRQEEINKLTQEKQLAALKGEADIDPSLEEDIARSETVLRERLRQQLGEDYETSEPGIRALAEFDKNKNTTLWYARHGEQQIASQMNLAQQQMAVQRRQVNTQALLAPGQVQYSPIAQQSYGVSPFRETGNVQPYASAVNQPGYVASVYSSSPVTQASSGFTGYSPQSYFQNIAAAQGIYSTGYQGMGNGPANYNNLAQAYSQQRGNEYSVAYNNYVRQGQLYGQIIGSVLGAVGGYFGGPQGAQAGYQSGQMMGMAIA